MIILTTGGSGGHIYPALAVAKELEARAHQVSFIGQSKGMEAQIIPNGGFDFYGVRAGKWHRQELSFNLISEPIKALLGFFDALHYLKRIKPKLVVGFGGFASFPALAAATLLHIPIVLHEANVFPGKVTRWFAGKAQLVIMSASAAKKHLLSAKNLVHISLPIREVSIDKVKARQQLGLPTQGLITLVMGGSQGSLTLNNYLPLAFQKLAVPNHSVLHVSGKSWYSSLKKELAHLNNYFVEDYVDASLAWSAVDVAVTRAGMSTLTEAAFHGVPLLMIPLPTAAENHQYYNAKAVELAGAGKVIEEKKLHKDLSLLKNIWQDMLIPSNNKLASQAALKRYSKGAAKQFVEILENNVN